MRYTDRHPPPPLPNLSHGSSPTSPLMPQSYPHFQPSLADIAPHLVDSCIANIYNVRSAMVSWIHRYMCFR